MQDCNSDAACAQACVANGTPEAETKLNALLACLQTACPGSDQACLQAAAAAECAAQVEACLGGGSTGEPNCPAAEPQLDGCEDGGTCICLGCNTDGNCSVQDDDCVCPDCTDDVFCGDASNCNNDGVCNPFDEGCLCADCATHPECGECVPGCGDGKNCGDDGCGGTCGACEAGAACGDDGICADVDECATENGGCDPNATCTNTDGGFDCQCKEGYKGDGKACHIDVCSPLLFDQTDAATLCPTACGDELEWTGAWSCDPDAASGAGCNPVENCVCGCKAKSVCTPTCGDKTCGDDGCGGSCGECKEGTSCNDAGACVAAGCCDPATEPGTGDNGICFEGSACCKATAQWACSIGDGDSFPCGDGTLKKSENPEAFGEACKE